jgi:hypothetical protein
MGTEVAAEALEASDAGAAGAVVAAGADVSGVAPPAQADIIKAKIPKRATNQILE